MDSDKYEKDVIYIPSRLHEADEQGIVSLGPGVLHYTKEDYDNEQRFKGVHEAIEKQLSTNHPFF